MTLRDCLREDLYRFLNQSPAHRANGDTLKARISAWLSAPLQCVAMYRISHWCWERNWRRAARTLAALNVLVFKANVSPASTIGPGLFLPHPPGTVFCGRAGRGFTMYSIAACCPRPESSWFVENGPQIGDGVTIGGHAVLQGPIRVGDRARIGFTVCIDRDIPADVLVFSRSIRMTVTHRSEANNA